MYISGTDILTPTPSRLGLSVLLVEVEGIKLMEVMVEGIKVMEVMEVEEMYSTGREVR